MDAQARQALTIIRESVEADRFTVSRHFQERMDQRGFLWADVLAVLDAPSEVRDGGRENEGRPKWIISGDAADGLSVEMVCVLDRDEQGDWTVFITLY